MDKKKLLEELNKLEADQIAELIPLIIRKCFPKPENWKDYYYKYFPYWEKNGFHVTLNHFYSPLPEVYKLNNELWDKIPPTPNLDFKEKDQLALLNEFSKFQKEYNDIPIKKTATANQYYLLNGKYDGIDGYSLYCMIRHFKPKRIIEIGSGFSTLLTAQACLKNKEENGEDTKLIAIEPFPSNFLKAGFPGLSELITKKIQDADLKLFDQLQAGDFLFIDSSHVLKIDSDVKLEYTNILPRLKKDVIVHVHDIFLPAEYPKEFIFGLLFLFNEQYLVQSILANSDNYEILWAGHYMYLNHFNKLMKVFPNYKKIKKSPTHFSSCWIKKIK
ncbi:MAG: class I SAM-dependent methyltransferase [Candidatus Margulisiibacteriota bacterium]|nr:class I SAM-dependent methyltransferase [Candidatus Margulisiibacteriota bacterium]